MTTTFASLGLRDELLRALDREGYTTPTPIQAESIPPLLAGRNLLGLAQTGTGKTAAFLLPVLQKLSSENQKGRFPRALVLAPTRELALQIAQNAKVYGSYVRVPHVVLVGGVSYAKQINDLKRGCDLLIATPGRLVDLLEQGEVNLSQVQTFILDEADRMMDVGFLPSIKQIASLLPKDPQTLFFSATMPDAVAALAKQLLKSPVRVEVTPVATPVERIQQSVIMVSASEKRQVLADLMADPALERVIIFTRTKHGADRVAKLLEKINITVGAMHGRKSQAARQAVLADFSRGKIRALVATDVASRGIDVDNITHVINYEISHEPDAYVHRIGRTARAGRSGAAIALCAPDEKQNLRQIEQLTRQKISIVDRPPASGIVVPTVKKQTEDDAAEEALKAAEKPSRGGTKKPHRGRGPKPSFGSSERSFDRSSDRPARAERSDYADRPARAPRRASVDAVESAYQEASAEAQKAASPAPARRPRSDAPKPYGEKRDYARKTPFRSDKSAGGPRDFGDFREPGASASRGRPSSAKPAYKGKSEGYAGDSSYADKPARSYSKSPRSAGGDTGYGDKPARKPYGAAKPYGDRAPAEGRSYGDKPSYGAKRTYAPKSDGPAKPYGAKSCAKRSDAGDSSSYGERKPYGTKPATGRSYAAKPAGSKPSAGKSYAAKPASGPRSAAAGKPAGGGKPVGRRLGAKPRSTSR